MTNLNFNELQTRVAHGNDVLHAAWQEACRSDDDGYETILGRIDKSWPKLDRLCLELEASGFTDCLYDKSRCQRDGTDWFCYVCPSSIPYWREADIKQLGLIGGKG